MAKCIKQGSTIKRVSDNDAQKAVKEGWKYCPKNEYRTYIGKTKTVTPTKDEKVKSDALQAKLSTKGDVHRTKSSTKAEKKNG